MKKGLKIAALLTALVLGVAAFTGCGGSNSNTGSKTKLRVEIFERGDVPAGAGTITDNALTRWIQKEFGDPNNIEMEFVPVTRAQEAKQLNVLMAAGEAPDIVFTYTYTTMYNYSTQGGLTDLTDYIKDAPNLTQFLGNDVLELGQIDGRQMLIPARRMILGREAQIIRQDWLDKLGLEKPTTTDEFYTVLKAFKQQDPGNAGDKNIPWAISSVADQYLDLINTFVDRDKLTEAEWQTIPPVMRPGFKEGVRFMNKLYNEGLISPDFALDKDRKQMEADFANGYVGFVNDDLGRPIQNGGYFNTLKSNHPEAEISAVDTWTDKNGTHLKQIYSSNGLYIGIPASSKNPELAMKYLDWMSQQDIMLTLQFGWEGKNYTMDDEGYPVSIESDEAKTSHWYNLGFDTALVVNGKFLEDAEKSVKFNARATGVNSGVFEDCYRNSIRDGWRQVIMPPNEINTKYGTSLNEKYVELLTKGIMAAPSEFDTVYDELHAEYERIGGTELAKALRNQYRDIYGE